MELFSACYHLVWSAPKLGNIGDPSHMCIASHDYLLPVMSLSLSGHVQV